MLKAIFTYCPARVAFKGQLTAAKDLGFDAVIVSPYASLDEIRAFAENSPVDLIWQVNNPVWWRGGDPEGEYANFAQASGGEDLRTFIIKWLSALPATRGYYIADDTGITDGEAAAISAHNQVFKSVDPDALTMMGTVGYGDFTGANIRPWLHSADAVGHELYPIFSGDSQPPGQPQITDLQDWAGRIASGVQRANNEAGTQSAFILQAFSWGWHIFDARGQHMCSPSDSDLECQRRYRYPTQAEQQALLHGVLLNSRPQLIAWWLLEDVVGWPEGAASSAILQPTPEEITQRKAALKAVLAAPLPTPPDPTPAPPPVVPTPAPKPAPKRRPKLKITAVYWRRRARKGKWHHKFWNGHPPVASLRVKKFIMRGVAAGLVCTSTSDGRHTPTSYHYRGRAADLGLEGWLVGTKRGLKRLQRFQYKECNLRSRQYAELFGPINTHNVKNGTRISLAEGSALENLHDGHVHGAF